MARKSEAIEQHHDATTAGSIHVCYAQIEGVAPLLMKSQAGLDPTHPINVQMRPITSKRAKDKTYEDHERLKRLEWELGLYWAEDLGPYVPSEWVEAAIRDAARGEKQGKNAQAAVVIPEMRVRLEYEGPRDLKGLYEARRFCDYRRTTTQGGRGGVMRARPIFFPWSLAFEIHCDDGILGIDNLRRFLAIAGNRKGLGDYRPKYGRFRVVKFEDMGVLE